MCEKPVGLRLKQIHDEMVRGANAQLKAIDLTVSQLRVLCFLEEQAPQAVSQRQLERHLGVSHPTVVGLLSRLEQKNLVESRTDPQDHRCKNFVATEKSRVLWAQMQEHRRQMEQNLLQGLTSEQIEDLSGLLEQIYQNLIRQN